jgi:isopenicillin N synthase-like dioxygenase
VSVPVLDAEGLTARDVGRALRETGGFLLSAGVDRGLCDRVVEAAHAFFALPAEVKAATAIERSPHFRGWSEMHNERDWREQIHFGRERPAGGEEPPYRRLDGPNLWPPGEGWRAVITAYMNAVAAAGERILACAAQDLGAPAGSFAGVAREGYLLLKLIGYHPQPVTQVQRPGVAAHVDFSWITLTLQDSPGLQIRRPGGDWTEIPPLPGALWVHTGELLQVASGGAYPATPHRVTNASLTRTRVSLPLFLNPSLAGRVEPLVPGAKDAPVVNEAEGPHVHRVLPPDAASRPFQFGEAEWRRKGRNGWCHACAPPQAP